MSRLIPVWALALGLVLTAAAVVTPAEAARSRGRSRSLNGTFSGVITRLNRLQMSFESDGRGSRITHTVNYDDKTTVTGGSKKGSIDDLRVGQTVKVVVKNNRADKVDVKGE